MGFSDISQKTAHLRFLCLMGKKLTLVEKNFEQFEARFFLDSIYLQYNKIPEKILRQTARNFFQLELDFFGEGDGEGVKKSEL